MAPRRKTRKKSGKNSTTKSAVQKLKGRLPFWPYGTALFVFLLAIDQYTKHVISTRYVLGVSHQVFPGLWFTYVHNTGAIWSSFKETNGAFIWLSLIALGILFYYHDEFKTHIEKLCLVLLFSGIMGNFIDRVVRGFVVDFIDLKWWPVFNIADSAIVVGIIVYLLEQLRQNGKKSSVRTK